MKSHSLNTIRCPKCYLIPKFLNLKLYDNIESSFIFIIICPNNHFSIINNNITTNKIKFSLNDIPCIKCNKKDICQYYCKECYSILCETCKENHFLNSNHKNIKTINEIDNICIKHDQKFTLYCKNCNIEVCNQCIKCKEHEGHEINEIKTLNINKSKIRIKKYISNFPKNLDKDKQLEIKDFKQNINKYTSYSYISKIEEKYEKKKNKFLEFINYINDLINNYDLYIKYYEIPSHLIYKLY